MMLGITPTIILVIFSLFGGKMYIDSQISNSAQVRQIELSRNLVQKDDRSTQALLMKLNKDNEDMKKNINKLSAEINQLNKKIVMLEKDMVKMVRLLVVVNEALKNKVIVDANLSDIKKQVEESLRRHKEYAS